MKKIDNIKINIDYENSFGVKNKKNLKNQHIQQYNDYLKEFLEILCEMDPKFCLAHTKIDKKKIDDTDILFMNNVVQQNNLSNIND
jgi:hypothetical protein